MVIAVEQTVAKVGKLLGTNSLCVGASLGGAEPKSAIFRRFVRANNELHEQQREEEGEEEETRLEIARPLEVEARRPRASSAPGNSTPYSRTSFTMRRFPQTPANVPRGRARRFESNFGTILQIFFYFSKNMKFWKSFEELFSVEILVEEFLYLVGVFFSSSSCDRRNAEGGSNAKTRERSVI